MLGEKVVYAAISPHLYILSDIQAEFHLPLKQLQWENFDGGVGHVVKTTTAESNPKNSLTQRLFCPIIFARDNKMPLITVSVTADQGPVI